MTRFFCFSTVSHVEYATFGRNMGILQVYIPEISSSYSAVTHLINTMDSQPSVCGFVFLGR